MLTEFKQYNSLLTEADLDLVRPLVKRYDRKLGYQLLQQGHVCKNLYFLEKGAVRCHTFEDDRTLWYEFEGSFFTNYASFSDQTAARDCLTLLEPSVLYAIHHNDLHQLYQQNHAWANWGRLFIERWYLTIERLYQSLLYEDASKRYEVLLRLRPDITQRVPLHHIASFLGISSVSLSRIRAGKQKKRF